MKKNGSAKIKILFFAFGLIICIITIGFIYGVITKNKDIISDETISSTDCLYLDFKIEKASNNNQNITLFLKNPTSNTLEINKVQLKIDGKTYSKEQLIKVGETKSISFENVDISNNMLVYVNNCVGFEKKVVI